MLAFVIAVVSVADAQPVPPADDMCTDLLDAQKRAESQGHIDFSVVLETYGDRELVPGLGSYQASISSRLPEMGRDALDASTYRFTFNVLALARSSLRALTFMSRTAPVLLERPYLPGQGWISGFAVSPALSIWSSVAPYLRAQLGRGVHAMLEDHSRETLTVPLVDGSRPAEEYVVCTPPRSRWRWLRRGAIHAIDIALATALP